MSTGLQNPVGAAPTRRSNATLERDLGGAGSAMIEISEPSEQPVSAVLRGCEHARCAAARSHRADDESTDPAGLRRIAGQPLVQGGQIAVTSDR
jgi:hypothetical protein